ncbi:MAG: bifunctional heptose 7-phosphate kinase/heptose 1-phosphate adenyltransferase [Bacteroidota bacterium]
MNPFARFFQELPGLRVAVIGDLMLDTYFFGQVDRMSPEAPVPVVTHQHQEERIGGAGNVALNLRSLGASVHLISLIGQDEPGHLLKQLLESAHIDTSLLFVDPLRPTTQKTRVLDRNKQLLRLDKEVTHFIDPAIESAWLGRMEEYIRREKPQLLIFEDYNKGVLTKSLISQLILLCKSLDIVTAVDPKKENFFAYQGVDVFKPNWREVSEALDLHAEPNANLLQEVHRSLHSKLAHHVSLITLSDKGVFYQDELSSAWLSGHARQVTDVSGAGDTVIAVAAAAYALTREASCMANLANVAGGLVCEQVGTSSITPDQLQQESIRLGWL